MMTKARNHSAHWALVLVLANCRSANIPRYRLSPEHPFPTPFEDSLRAARWFIQNAKDYGVDSKRIGIGGDSAGGYLTALITQFLRKDDLHVKVQMLIYPAITILDPWSPSHQKHYHDFGDGGILSRSRMARFYTYFIFGRKYPEFEELYKTSDHVSSEMKKGEFMQKKLNHSIVPPSLRLPSYYRGPSDPNSGSDKMWNEIKKVSLDPRFNALVNPNLKGLPPAYIVTCGFDSIRDDGIFYGEALKEAGVEVQWKHYETGFHGIFWASPLFNFELGSRMRHEALEYVKSKL